MDDKIIDRRITKRWGRWRISGKFIAMLDGHGVDSEEFKSVVRSMRDVLVLRAEHNISSDEIVYWGISPIFDEIEEGHHIPWYVIECHKSVDPNTGETKEITAAFKREKMVNPEVYDFLEW